MTKMISSMVPIDMWPVSIQLVGFDAELNHLKHRPINYVRYRTMLTDHT
jgi:hypothetical protein